MARYQRMRGRPTLWLPGTDHAGIATQVGAGVGQNQQPTVGPVYCWACAGVCRCWTISGAISRWSSYG